MKTSLIKTAFFSSLLLFFLQLASAQVKETREMKDFTNINVGGGIDLFIEQGDQVRVIAEAGNQQMLESLVTEVDGNTLKIHNSEKFWRPGSRKVYVTVKNIEGINASGGSDVYSENGIKVTTLKLTASGGSDIEMKLEAGELVCTISGGSDARLFGKAGKFSASASGGSNIKAKELVTDISDIHASGGSDVYITVNDELSAKTSGGSDIDYYGDAKVTNINANGGSDVNKK